MEILDPKKIGKLKRSVQKVLIIKNINKEGTNTNILELLHEINLFSNSSIKHRVL